MDKLHLLFGIITIFLGLVNSEETGENNPRKSKVCKYGFKLPPYFPDISMYVNTSDFFQISVPVFQVVRFPNDICVVSGTKNGTCYTA